MDHLEYFLRQLYETSRNTPVPLPDKQRAHCFVDQLIQFLFPVTLPLHYSEYRLEFKRIGLLLYELLIPVLGNLDKDPDWVCAIFFDKLPLLHERLLQDAQAIFRFDPAAYSLQEVITAYPGFYAVAVYRLAHELYLLQIPMLPRLLAEYAHRQTGIDINPGASIGNSFFIDHGTGVVIGETACIGDNVKIYQGVTLGALSVEKSFAQKKRHPTIEDNVVIYAGSTILGGETVIGHDSVIGGNVWLTRSVEPHSVVYHKSEIRVGTNKIFDEPINFMI